MAEVVLFDVDGVLVDSLDSHLKICEHLNKEYRLGLRIPTAQEFRALVRSGARISPMTEFFTAVGFPSNRIEEADLYYQKHFAKDFPLRIFPGIPELLQRLHDSGVHLGVVTSNVRVIVESALGPCWNLFEPRLCFTFDDPRALSKSQALGVAANELGIAPGPIVYIGDQPADYRAAQEAGTAFLGVTWGWAIARGDPGIQTFESPEAIGDYLMSIIEKPSTGVNEQLKTALEHGRSMFTYHAGQRHGSLNFYFAVLGAFVAGFVSLFTADKLWASSYPAAPIIGTIVGIAAIRITFLFGRLDQRNADLVEWDEELLKRAEHELRSGRPEFRELEITTNSDNPPPNTVKRAPRVTKNYYKYHYWCVVPDTLLVFKILFGLAIAGSWIFWSQTRNVKPEDSRSTISDPAIDKLRVPSQN